MIAQNTGANVQKLLRLREAGLRIFMDDFGTGYFGLEPDRATCRWMPSR